MFPPSCLLYTSKKMKWALAEFLVEGVTTNIDFQLSLLRDKNFESAQYDIGYLGRRDVMKNR